MRMLLIYEDVGTFRIAAITELGESLLDMDEHIAQDGFWEKWSDDISYKNLIYKLNDYFGVKTE